MKKFLLLLPLTLLLSCKKNKTYNYELSVATTEGNHMLVMLGEEYLHIGEVKTITFKAGYNPPEVRASVFDNTSGDPVPVQDAHWTLKRGGEIVSSQDYYVFLWN